jgi:hypothetical protein
MWFFRFAVGGGKRSLSPIFVLMCLAVWQTCGSIVQAQVSSQPKLKVVVVEGEGAVNDIGAAAAAQPVVRIEGENAQPLSGAMRAVFYLPETGPGGRSDGSKSLIVTPTSKAWPPPGTAINKMERSLQVRWMLPTRGLTASAVVSQTNVVPIVVSATKPQSKKGFLFVIIGGVAAAAGVLAASKAGAVGVAHHHRRRRRPLPRQSYRRGAIVK